MNHICFFAIITIGVFVLPGASVAKAQTPAVNTTVQLPSVRNFGVSTTVMVPDGGTMVIGGGSASSSSYRRQGLSRTSSRIASRPGVSVSAKLIVGSEVDAELLRRGKAAIADRARPDIHGTAKEKSKALFLARNLGRGLK